MTTRDEVDALSSAARDVSDLAVAELKRLFATFDMSSPAAVRGMLIEIVPELVATFGDVAATAAAEWYENVRARQVGGSYRALTGYEADRAAVEGSVRWAADALWSDDPSAALYALAGAVQRHVTYSSRSTVARNAEHDPLNPRYARVPKGPKSCAWCAMLASRGFVYTSKRTAGDTGRGVGDDFHDGCDCAVVIEFDSEAEHIAGYDPDALYEKYLAAREATGEAVPSQEQIAAQMRRLFPDSFKDGVYPPV